MIEERIERESEVIQGLQQQLANAFLLYANYKKYHWQSYGPHFRDMHLLFDEQGKTVLDTIDELGERVRILGGAPVADPREFIERGTVETAGRNEEMKRMVQTAAKNAKRVYEEMRLAVKTADENGDPGTADLFTRLLQIHEKNEWFLRESLKSGDGLSK